MFEELNIDEYEQSWDELMHLAGSYFNFWPNKADYQWFIWVWCQLDSRHYFDKYESREAALNAHVVLLALIYNYYSRFENINESHLFTDLSAHGNLKLEDGLTFNSKEILIELVEELQSFLNEFVAELCVSYLVGSQLIKPGAFEVKEKYNFFIEVKGDIYSHPCAADIHSSLCGYTGRSGKIDLDVMLGGILD